MRKGYRIRGLHKAFPSSIKEKGHRDDEGKNPPREINWTRERREYVGEKNMP